MRIRLMTTADYEAVYALWMACKGMGLNNLDDSPEGIARFLERNPETCFVAETDTAEDDQNPKIVGVILAGHDGRRGYIYHTAAHPEFRHRGIATALVEATTAALKRQNINKVALVVFSKNDDGNRFWEALGFTQRTDLTYRNLALTDITRIDT